MPHGSRTQTEHHCFNAVAAIGSLSPPHPWRIISTLKQDKQTTTSPTVRHLPRHTPRICTPEVHRPPRPNHPCRTPPSATYPDETLPTGHALTGHVHHEPAKNKATTRSRYRDRVAAMRYAIVIGLPLAQQEPVWPRPRLGSRKRGGGAATP